MVEIPRKCNINCRLVFSVEVLHAVRDPTLGIAKSIGGKLLKNRGLIPYDMRKYIGAQEEAEND